MFLLYTPWCFQGVFNRSTSHEWVKRQPQKMVKHTQTICWLLLTNCLSVFDDFVGFALKESSNERPANHLEEYINWTYQKKNVFPHFYNIPFLPCLSTISSKKISFLMVVQFWKVHSHFVKNGGIPSIFTHTFNCVLYNICITYMAASFIWFLIFGWSNLYI